MGSDEKAAAGPLEGTLVIDLTRVLSGPYATMLLGDLGATIVKIEDPKSGDTTRHSAPFKNGQSHYFLAINRNKKSLALDLSTPGGREVLLALCRKADVLIENFRPGTMERLGIGFDVLHDANPDLVVCSISGFGQSGPLRDKIAYDVITQAMSGVLSTNGEAHGAPVRLSVPIGDLSGGMMATIAILAALMGRQKSRDNSPNQSPNESLGKGHSQRHIDISLHDGLLSTLTYMATLYDMTERTPQRSGSRHPSVVPYGTFRTSDGWLALAIFTTPFWRKFCNAVGWQALGEDARFARTRERMHNRIELETMVEELIASRTTAEWEDILRKADVPASAILTVPEAVEHEHTTARGMFPTLTHPVYGSFRAPGPPIRLGGRAVETPTPPPLLGEHSRYVLRDLLGMNAEAIAALAAERVITISDEPPLGANDNK